ncbi:sigma-70 family RNA polymerase sigma factor [Microlunatus parietis]|uniref:RNA polymerase sigma factor (Sigma-70 family) n=1 Tax=Microlunatus parietis TaxID=682979 RepID=A0A7Y9IB44_9ACTN|nr:sigma-70 family RNA polymerase sigma factor [Microlunatus parietis]NYE73311.1 RNA polymerase sigma factor (sigma-70 family) [Microlunatus parietis]
MSEAQPAIEDLLRTLAPQVLGALIRRYGDFDGAEDAVQEAMITALERWPRDGVPEHPRGWLITAASHRLIDRWRSELARREREEQDQRRTVDDAEVAGTDDTLTLLFLCCHPALTPASAIALTLRAVGGLTTDEIARAFLVPSATMGQRISRAKGKIKSAGGRFVPPTPEERPARLSSVLRVLYLIFTEGHTATAGDRLHRVDLSDEAIRLARLLRGLLPEDGEVAGLLALLLLVDARRAARIGRDGLPIPLAEQDRSRWDRKLIMEGRQLLDEVFGRRPVGEYQLQAAIASLHDHAPTAAATDWPHIVALYGALERITASPVVTLNRAVAVGQVDGPRAGLAVVDDVAEVLAGQQRLYAVRAHLLEQAGDHQAARADYLEAARLATGEPERRFLVLRASWLNAGRPEV